MKHFSLTLALAIATTSAFGSENQDYHFKLLVETGQTISGFTLAQIGDPAINNLNNVIFTVTAKAPIGPSTFPAGLFSPEKQIAPYTGYSGTPCLAPYAINDANQVAFAQGAKLGPTMPNVAGLYETTWDGAPVQTLLAPGAVVDGVALTANFCGSNENGSSLAFDDAGRAAFFDTGGLYRYKPGKGVSKINITKVDGLAVYPATFANGSEDKLLFVENASSFSAIFDRHHILVKTPENIDGVKVASIVLAQGARNDKFVFLANVGSATSSNYGLFKRDKVVALSGHKLDGKSIASGEAFFGVPAINSRGQVAFAASTGAAASPQPESIFIDDKVLVSTGDTICGHTISSLDSPVLNDSGVIAFLTTFSDGSEAIVEATKGW